MTFYRANGGADQANGSAIRQMAVPNGLAGRFLSHYNARGFGVVPKHFFENGRIMVKRVWLAGWIALGAAVGANAQNASRADALALRETWAGSAEWHTLLYYHDQWLGVASEADDPAFFLAPTGKLDPLAELNASLEAFAQPAPAGDAHPQCRFPARYQWLKQVATPLMQDVQDQDCPAFSAFRERMAAKSVTMVYPVPNMDDVSTLFGHSFLRLDRDPAPTADKADDYTLNFAALVKKGDGQIDLVAKGLRGRLEGVFTILPYRKKLKEYLRMESRDVWEYRLDLTQAETDQLVRHAWEMRTARFEYEFFAENCSYRMLNFIDVARPGVSLHQQYSLYVVPLDAVESVIDAGLVNNVQYQPSEESSRMAAPAPVPRPLQPGDVGHYSGRVRVSGGEREGLTVAGVSVRPAYHDFLDAPMGGPLAEISALELSVRQIEAQSVELTELTFFAASSLKTRNALYSPWSWRAATGVTGVRWREEGAATPVFVAENERDAYLQALDASDWINPLYARFVLGPAWGNRDIAFYQLLGAELQVAGKYAHGSEVLALWNPGIVARSEHWQAQLDLQVKEPASDSWETFGLASASLSRRLNTDVALFVRGVREKDVLGFQNEYQVGASVYF